MTRSTGNRRALIDALVTLRTPHEWEQFLTDLCTPGELEALDGRWRVAQLLADGVPYRRIYEVTGVSTATVTRVARALEWGEGGYAIALNRVKAAGGGLVGSPVLAGQRPTKSQREVKP